MSLLDILGWIAAIAGGLVGLHVIWRKGLRPVWRFLRRVEAVHGLIIEDLPTFMQATREWQAGADDVLKQLQPNSGSSMFDRMARIERQLNAGNGTPLPEMRGTSGKTTPPPENRGGYTPPC